MSVMQTTLENPSVTRQGKFFYVFACQVLLLVLFPYLTQPGLPLVLFRLLGAVALVSGVYAVSDKRAQWIGSRGTAPIRAILSSMHGHCEFAGPKLFCYADWVRK